MHGLHLNEHGARKLALNFVKRIMSKLNSGPAKQELKKIHSNSVVFENQATNQDLKNLRQFMPYRTTLMTKL